MVLHQGFLKNAKKYPDSLKGARMGSGKIDFRTITETVRVRLQGDS